MGSEYVGRNVYVTGGSAGIGLETAKLFSAGGAHVIIFARSVGRLEQAAGEIAGRRRSESQRVSFMQMDVSKHDEVRSVVDRAAAEFGAPHVLINCAGRAQPRRFEEITYEQFDETMKINLYGIWNTCQAALPYMKQAGRGYIVNVSSIAGLVGVFGYTDYAASKFAVIGFSDALRSELKQFGIGVSVLCPPDTDTPGLMEENKTKPDETRAITEGVKLMRPEGVARALLRGMERHRPIIIPGTDGKLTVLAKRLAPSLVELIMDRQIRKVQQARR